MGIFGMELKTVLMVVLGTVVVLALAFPAFKAGLLAWLKAKGVDVTLLEKKNGGIAAVALRPAQPADELVKQRVLSLETACPKATPEHVVKWLKAGFDEYKARGDYIEMLLKREAAPPA